ncbi:MAG: hypothetical protein QNJ89_10575 [Acidimicrobiia bacterium]|nr:hypothetical protein [Acidimicrobiia bacterium]
MSDAALFGIGSIVFIFATWATLMFLYWRFNEVYRSDQPGDESGSSAVDGLELTSSPQNVQA